MSIYINTNTNDYPLFEGDIRLLYPDMGTEFVLPAGFAEVEETPVPTLEIGQTFDEFPPVFDSKSKKYQRSFGVRDMTKEEITKIKNYRETNYPDYPSGQEPYNHSIPTPSNV
jgi:hypothetical protein